MLHINHTEPSCQIPGNQHTSTQSHRLLGICSAGLKNSVQLEVYKSIFLPQNIPGQASLSFASKHPEISFLFWITWHQTTLLFAVASSGKQFGGWGQLSWRCADLLTGRRIEIPSIQIGFVSLKTWQEQTLHYLKKIYFLELCFLEMSWRLFAGQSHLIWELSILSKRTSSKAVSGMSIWYRPLETASSAMSWLRHWN